VSQLSRIFRCDVARERKEPLATGLKDPKICGRHLAFDEDSEGGILESIEAEVKRCEPVIGTDFRHYCEAKYSYSVGGGWIDSFIPRYREDLTAIKNTSQENMRV
jgi:hypothetical protein